MASVVLESTVSGNAVQVLVADIVWNRAYVPAVTTCDVHPVITRTATQGVTRGKESTLLRIPRCLRRPQPPTV